MIPGVPHRRGSALVPAPAGGGRCKRSEPSRTPVPRVVRSRG